MKGYAILTTELQILVKDKDYIDNFEPTFWGENKRFILRSWEFNTDNLDTVKRIIIYLRGLGTQSLPIVKIENFITQIGLTKEMLKKSDVDPIK